MAIYSEFSHKEWQFSIVMLVYQKVNPIHSHEIPPFSYGFPMGFPWCYHRCQVLIAKAFRLVRRQRIALGLLLFEWGRAARRRGCGEPWDVAGRGWAETQQLRWENDGKSRKVTEQMEGFPWKIHGNNGDLQKKRLEVEWFFFTVKTIELSNQHDGRKL